MFWPRLLLTLGSVAAVSAVSAQQITVQPGDTLWDIAARYDTSVNELLIANGLTRTTLRPGETLRVPVTTYTVRRGDTLSGIAAAFGTTMAELRALNGLGGSSLRAGQTLLVKEPFGDAPSAARSSLPTETYTVRPGDTLSGVAARAGLSTNELRRLNALAGSYIRVGQRLVLRAPDNTSLATVDSYTVRPGDTLIDIAAVFGTTPSELRALNDLRGSAIRSGQVLQLPGSSQAAAAATDIVSEAVSEAEAPVASEDVASEDVASETPEPVANEADAVTAEAADEPTAPTVAEDAAEDAVAVSESAVSESAASESTVSESAVTVADEAASDSVADNAVADVAEDAAVADANDEMLTDVTADSDTAAETAAESDTATESDIATDEDTDEDTLDAAVAEDAVIEAVVEDETAEESADAVAADVAAEGATAEVAPTVAPTPVAAASVTVTGGETLDLLAERFGVPVEAIVKLNGFTGTDLLTDAVVRIPFPESIVTQEGDTLEAIAARFQTTVEAIVELNGFTGTDVMPWATVKIPATPEFYQVQPGDTISEIAEDFDVSMAELRLMNGLSNNVVRAGEALRVRRPISATVLAGEPTLGAAAEAAAEAAETETALTETAPAASAAPAAPAEVAQVVVKPGDTLWDLAQRYDTTIAALQNENNLRSARLVPGTTLRLPSGSNSRPDRYRVQSGDTLYDIAVAFEISVDDIVAINNLDGATIQVGQELALTTTTPPAPLSVTVRPGDSLWLLAREHDVSMSALRSVNSLSVDTLQPGDTLTIPGRYASVSAADQGGSTAPTITVGRGESLWLLARRHGTSVTALMAANNLRGTNVYVGQRLRLVPGSELSPAVSAAPTPAPAPATQAAMVWPLNGVITSRFGYRRLRIGGSNYHTGLDIDGEIGDPIYSATSGRVTFSGWRAGYGNLVIVRSGNREYYYAHGAERRVAAGETVRVGQVVATVGVTGITTGSHLHFEIRENGRPIDPLPVLQQQAVRL